MSLDLRFDPVTMDLVDAPDGSFEETDTAETAVMQQLTHHLGEWWGDPDAGSRLHDLRRFQADPAASIVDEAARALGVLESEGIIADIEIDAEEPRPGRVNVATRFRDVSSGQIVDTFVAPGGGGGASR